MTTLVWGLGKPCKEGEHDPEETCTGCLYNTWTGWTINEMPPRPRWECVWERKLRWVE